MHVIVAVAGIVFVSAACSGAQADVSPEPTSAPLDSAEAARLVVQCLNDRGWDAKADGGDWESGELHEDQIELFLSDEADCEEAIGLETTPDISEQEAREFFAGMRRSANCLSDLGIDVPEPPSEEAFVEALVTREEVIWSYAEGVDGSQGVATNEKIDECLDLLGR